MISVLTFKPGASVCCVAVCALLAIIYPATGVPINRVADPANTLDPSVQAQPGLPDSLHSRDMSETRPMCVELVSDAGVQRSVPIRLGSTLRLSFRHSIYGSQAEELFTLRRNGFELAQLRYSEARLVEFYGHEDADSEHDMWVVRPRATVIPSLSVRASADASLWLSLDQKKKSFQLTIPADSALHLTIAHCKDAPND